LSEVLKEWLQEPQAMMVVIYLRKQLNLEHIGVSPSKSLQIIISEIVGSYSTTHKADVTVISMLLCSQVKLEANSGSWLPGHVNKLPGYIVVSWRDSAAIALECNRWPIARVLATVGQER